MPVIKTGTGAEVYARELAKGLQDRGHSVSLDSVDHRYQYCPWLAPISPPPQCNAIVANSWSAVGFATGSIPLVTVMHHVVHDPAITEYKTFAQRYFHRFFVRPMENAAMRKSTVVIAVSETTASAVRAFFPPVNLATVLNGIDTDFYVPRTNHTPAYGRDRVRLLFVGKPSRRKGFDLVARLIDEFGDRAELIIVGQDGERGLPPVKGSWLGRVPRDELRLQYQMADFLLMPSRIEGFGYAAAEAMACGTPVVCLPGGAVAEITSPPNAAVLLDEGNVAGSVKTLIEIMAEPAKHRSMRYHARRIACDNLSKNRWIEDIEDALRDAIRS